MKKLLVITIILQFVILSLKGQNWDYSNFIEGNILPQKSVIDQNNNVYILSEVYDSIKIEGNWIKLRGGYDLLLNKFDSEGNLDWYKLIGGSSADLAGGLVITNENNLVVCGNFMDTCYFSDVDYLISQGSFDIFLTNFDLDGNLSTYKTIIKGSSIQRAYSIYATENNDILISGKFVSSITYSTTGSDLVYNSDLGYGVFFEKVNDQFEYVFSSSFDANNNASVISQISEVDDGFLFSGNYRNSLELDIDNLSSSSNSADIYLYKTNSSGVGLWVRTIGGTSTEALYSLKTDLYDNSYILGYYQSASVLIDSTETQQTSIDINYGGRDIFIFKYNKSGNLSWKINEGSILDDNYYDMDIKGDIIYSVGLFSDEITFNNDILTSSFGQDGFLAALNSIGDPIAGIGIHGLDGNENCKIINADDNLNAYVIGYSESSNISIGDSTFLTPIGTRNLFFAKYSHPFKAAFTNENQISCSGQSDGMLTVTPYFGVPPYTYSWSKDGSSIVGTDSIATGLDAGLYRVSVTDSRDSIAIAQVNVTDPATLNISYSVSEVTCNNGSDGGIDLTVTGGNNNYEYNWAGGTGLNPTIQDQIGLTAANYSVTVTDLKGCTASQIITVGEPDPITFGESVVVSTNADQDTGRIDLVLAGGTGPYGGFFWEGTDGFTSSLEDISNLSGGNYSVTVTDANSCLGDTTFLVPNDSLFIGFMTSIQNVTCGNLTNGQAAVSSNRHPGTFEYIWIDLEDSTQVGGNFASITNLDSSLYRVYIVDAVKEDTTFVNFEISKPVLLVANSIASNPTCNGNDDGFINAIVSGGTLPYTYSWSTGSTNEDLTGIHANGTYSLTVTDANNCTATTSETLDDPSVMEISVDKTNPLCYNELSGEATANVTGGVFPYNYIWDDPGNQSEQTATGLGSGLYNVTVTDQNGCTVMSSANLSNPAPISIISIDSVDISCFGADDGSIEVIPGGGSGSYTYNWSHIGTGTDLVENLTQGNYTITINDVNDCTPVIKTITINEPTEIVVTIDTVDNICFGENNGEITVTPTGGSGSFDYTWGHTSSNIGALTSLVAGTYNLTLSDGSCPDLTYSIPVDEPDEIIVTVDTTDISCLNAADGKIALSTVGGTGSYTYTWNHDVTTEDTITITTGGTYTVSINDGACPDIVRTIPVNEPNAFVADIDTVDLTCYNFNNGIITVTPSGGSENYSYNWAHTTDNVNQVADLASGNYDVTISDGSCPDISASIFVDQPTALIFDIDTTDVSCMGFSNGSIVVNTTGGSGNYDYTWGHTASNVSELGGLSGGTYNLTISDGACPDSSLAIPVNEPAEFVVAVNKEDLTCYNSGDGSIQLNISGGSENYDISWGHSTTTATSLSNLDAGNYSVTVDDGKCPVKSNSIDVSEPNEFIVSGYDTVNLSEIGARDGQITIHVSGGVEPYRYLITGATVAQLDSVFNNLDAGKYTVIINDANNCGPIETDSIEIKAPTTGIVNYWEESSISYYPNPADDKVMIEINDVKMNSINLKVVNSMGSLLINRDFEIPNKQNRIELRTDRLSQGIYFILIDNIRLKTPLIIN